MATSPALVRCLPVALLAGLTACLLVADCSRLPAPTRPADGAAASALGSPVPAARRRSHSSAGGSSGYSGSGSSGSHPAKESAGPPWGIIIPCWIVYAVIAIFSGSGKNKD